MIYHDGKYAKFYDGILSKALYNINTHQKGHMTIESIIIGMLASILFMIYIMLRRIEKIEDDMREFKAKNTNINNIKDSQ